MRGGGSGDNNSNGVVASPFSWSTGATTTSTTQLSLSLSSSQSDNSDDNNSNNNEQQHQRMKVLVTGASGRTGQLVFMKLLQDPQQRFEPVALVRSESSAKKLLKRIQQQPNQQQQQQQPPNMQSCGLDQIVICDVTKLVAKQQQQDDDDTSTSSVSNILSSSSVLQDCSAMIICTSAVPVLRKRSLLSVLFNIPRNFLLRKSKLLDFSLLQFGWKQHQYPELVDYHGTIAQIDWAKNVIKNRIESTTGSSQVDPSNPTTRSNNNNNKSTSPMTTTTTQPTMHVVMVSSMGGTDPSNFLNRVGKRPDGSGHGDILLWKRKAERYLVESGLEYTILHPGGLLDTPDGVEELILDVDDVLLQQKKRSISRADVANLCLAALVVDDAVGKNRGVSFDCISQPSQTTTTTKPKTAEQVLAAFLETGRTANYDL